MRRSMRHAAQNDLSCRAQPHCLPRCTLSPSAPALDHQQRCSATILRRDTSRRSRNAGHAGLRLGMNREATAPGSPRPDQKSSASRSRSSNSPAAACRSSATSAQPHRRPSAVPDLYLYKAQCKRQSVVQELSPPSGAFGAGLRVRSNQTGSFGDRHQADPPKRASVPPRKLRARLPREEEGRARPCGDSRPWSLPAPHSGGAGSAGCQSPPV